MHLALGRWESVVKVARGCHSSSAGFASGAVPFRSGSSCWGEDPASVHLLQGEEAWVHGMNKQAIRKRGDVGHHRCSRGTDLDVGDLDGNTKAYCYTVLTRERSLYQIVGRIPTQKNAWIRTGWSLLIAS